MPFVSENRLEEALVRAVENPATAPDFYRLLLESEKAGYDVGSYRDAPPGLRIWCGATVETEDIEALCPWLDWAFAEAMNSRHPGEGRDLGAETL